MAVQLARAVTGVPRRREDTRLWQEMTEQPDVLRRALDANSGRLAQLRALSPARIRLVGHGSSRHAAAYGAMVVEARSGIPCDVVPAPDSAGGSALYGAGDLAIALSQSGRTPSVVAAASRAQRAGAVLVALTNDATSPLARDADLVLDCCCGEERAVPATKTFLAQAGLLLALGAGDGVARSAAAPIVAVLSAPAGEPLRPGMVVGVRSAGPIAAEVALKFAEIAGHAVVGVDAAEALHGPVSAGHGPLLVLSSRPDANVDRLRSHRPVVLAAAPAWSGDEDADALVLAVAGQNMALQLALALGRNPDAPPHLRKVTVSA